MMPNCRWLAVARFIRAGIVRAPLPAQASSQTGIVRWSDPQTYASGIEPSTGKAAEPPAPAPPLSPRMRALAEKPMACVPTETDVGGRVESEGTTSPLTPWQASSPPLRLARSGSSSNTGASCPAPSSALGDAPDYCRRYRCRTGQFYNQGVLASTFNGAHLKNTTGKHLVQGPITVLDATPMEGICPH